MMNLEQTCQREESNLTSNHNSIISSAVESVHGSSAPAGGKVRTTRTQRQKKTPYSVPSDQVSPVSLAIVLSFYKRLADLKPRI